MGMVVVAGLGETGGDVPGSEPVDDPLFSPGLSSEVSNLPAYSGTTEGVGEINGNIVRLESGRKMADAQWIREATDRLRAAGSWRYNSLSGSASDVEQKFAAMMPQEGASGTLVINKIEGPCQVQFGCDQSLNTILGSSTLRCTGQGQAVAGG